VSVNALLKAVEARVRDLLADPAGKLAGVQLDGRPPPNCGQWYYAVHWAGGRGSGSVGDHDVTHAVTVTITARMAYAPQDRRGARLTLDGELIARAEALAGPGVVHGSYAVLNAANALIAGATTGPAPDFDEPTVNGYVEPLCLLNWGPVAERDGAWVDSEEDDPPTVLSVEVRFGLARRVQRIY